jgi:trypsin
LINVIAVHTHPNYNGQKNDYDFAVMQLSKVSNFPKNVDFIKLPDGMELYYEGEETFVSGWGNTKNLAEDSEYLRAVEVPIYSYEKCRLAYEKKIKITNQMICAGVVEGGKDSCQGDN